MKVDEVIKKRFAAATFGQSVRTLDLSGKRAEEIHALLVARRFEAVRVPVPGGTSRQGATTMLADETSGEWVYVHPDGGLVRVFPFGHPSLGLGLDMPCARVSVQVSDVAEGAVKGFPLERELFVVGEGGSPLPTSPCPEHGLRAESEPFEDRKLALELLLATRVRLTRAEPVAVPVARDHVGLGVTRTIVPDEAFDETKIRVLEAAREGQGIVPLQRHGVLHLVFVGSPRVDFERYGGYRGLASLAIHDGHHTLRIDPIGHGASIDALRWFLESTLSPGFSVYDDATGEDVTAVVRRFPSFLLSPSRAVPRNRAIAAADPA